jgi:hypothetical protein
MWDNPPLRTVVVMWTIRFMKNGGRRPLHCGGLYPFSNLPVLSVIRRKKNPHPPGCCSSLLCPQLPSLSSSSWSSSTFAFPPRAFLPPRHNQGADFMLIAFKLHHWGKRKMKKTAFCFRLPRVVPSPSLWLSHFSLTDASRFGF